MSLLLINRKGRPELLIAVATLALGTLPASAKQLDRTAAYKALTGDDLPNSDPPPVAVAAWAGGSPDTLVVATLDGDDDASDDLGSLRVGLLARQGPALKVVASNENVNEADLKRAIEPSRAEVRIDPAAFRIGPHEVAVAVDVSETMTTTSTLAGASTLFLYRRVGAKLLPIFSAPTDDTTLDKTARGRETGRHWTVGFHAAPHTRLLRSRGGAAWCADDPYVSLERVPLPPPGS